MKPFAHIRNEVTCISRTLLYFLCAVLCAAELTSCTSLGKLPSNEQKLLYSSSPNFDAQNGVFINVPEPQLDVIWKQRENDYVEPPPDASAPDRRLPDVKPDFTAFVSNDSDLKCMWFGHSSLLLKVGDALILIDPVFGRSSPFPLFGGARFQKPPFSREELPKIDFIVISHDHYDHLEKATIKFFAKTDTLFIVPLGVSSHLLYWGVKKENIVEKDWWESVARVGIEFIAAPARHSCGRTSRSTNYTQWSSWVIRSKKQTLYYSGDSGYGKHFREIGERFGPFDVVFLESGQYNPSWRSHLLPDEWPIVLRELKGKKWFPVHWGMFSFAPHEWDEPIIAAYSLAQKNNIPLMTPQIGETVDLNSTHEFVRWWEE